MTEYICEGCGGLDAPCRAIVPDYVGPPDSCLYGGGTKEGAEVPSINIDKNTGLSITNGDNTPKGKTMEYPLVGKNLNSE